MDRNTGVPAHRKTIPVALRKESVDRNYIIKITESPRGVALRKESVDRNTTIITICIVSKSLSARRAWIEIFPLNYLANGGPVALRKESVDRNVICSSIRIFTSVALRKESVDRNKRNAVVAQVYARRSPQGERG